MEIRKNFQHEGFSLMNSNSSLKIFLLPSKFNAQYSNFHLRIHDPHFLTITLNFYKFHNTNGNRHTFQSNLNFYRNLRNPLRLNHGIFHPLSFSLYFSHISKFHSIKNFENTNWRGVDQVTICASFRLSPIHSDLCFATAAFLRYFSKFYGIRDEVRVRRSFTSRVFYFFFPLFLSPSSPLLSS